jgi:hypothetical protein
MQTFGLDRTSDGAFFSVRKPDDAMWLLPTSVFPEHRWLYAERFPLVGRTAAIISSRIGQDIGRRAIWFEHLNCLLRQFSATSRPVLTCPTTTCHRYIFHSQPALGFGLVQCVLPVRMQSATQWLAHLGRASSESFSLPTQKLSVSPQVAPTCQGTDPLAQLPLADRLLTALGDDVYVLSVRPGGQMEQLIDRGLSGGSPVTQRWMFAVGPDLVPPMIAQRWLKYGATAWYLNAAVPLGAEGGSVRDTRLEPAPIVPLSAVRADDYLAHWTRAQPGPWPDQSEQQYVCGLLFDPYQRDRSALASLLRIIGMRRLIATSRLTRAATKVVCFTDLPLNQFGTHRVYRPMHRRWDFEPYGLCIDRQWLARHGVRPVIYGDDGTWKRLADDQRPYFQFRGLVDDSHLAGFWTQEKEWRHVGDLDLVGLSFHQGLVFVPDAAAAAQMATISPWPITILM